MDFFASQDQAHRQTRILVALFLLAVAAIVIAVDAVVALAYMLAFEELKLPPRMHGYVALATLALIGAGSLYQMIRLAAGGEVVARSVGARRVPPETRDPLERRLLNVVEEMAIASGVSVPRVYIMDREASINAFAAGFSPNDAVVAVTRGTLESLKRDELQGVVAHEFSHILNGDMRLNMRLMGLLFGILVIALLGNQMREVRISARDEKSGGAVMAYLLLSLALTAIGYIGVFFGRLIQAAVSRQREFLADASAVQFTRNPDGIGGALRRIARNARGSLIGHPRAEAASHMYFGQAVSPRLSDLLATHPPLRERIRRVYGGRIPEGELPPVEPPGEAPAAPGAAGFAAAAGEAAPDIGFGRGNRRFVDPRDLEVVAKESRPVLDAVGKPQVQHVDYSARLLATIGPELREAMRTARGARAAPYGLVLALGGAAREEHLALLRERGEDVDLANRIAQSIRSLGGAYRLPLLELALPGLKEMDDAARAQFLQTLERLMAVDRRISLGNFVLTVILERRLRADAAKATPVSFRSLAPLAGEIGLLLSLIAYAGKNEDARAAFDRGLAAAGAGIEARLLDQNAVTLAAARAALKRLNELAPMPKGLLVKSCVECALADGQLRVAEAELLRAIATAVDCPLPPFVERMELT